MLAHWPPEVFHKLPRRVIKDLISAMHYSNNERGLKDLVSDLVSGNKQVWIHSHNNEFNGTIVTQLTDFPGKKTCEILYLGGDTAGDNLMEFIEEIAVIERWARHNNCDDIQAIGREGWVKVLNKYGYQKRYVVTGKLL